MHQISFLQDVQACRCRVVPENGSLVFYSPYDPILVASIKSRIPAADRKFDPVRKAWVVSAAFQNVLAGIVDDVFHEKLNLPQINTVNRQETKLFRVRYIGACKDRGGENAAFGLVEKDWTLIFPETVLRDWFEAGPEIPTNKSTLYSVLGIRPSADPDEVKAGFRRIARQWHPDVCKEPNAQEVFIQIQNAYSILCDQNKRARYDAGLALEQTLENKTTNNWQSVQAGYRSPLRCGWILCSGVEKIGRFAVEKILAWEDVIENGATLVTSWPMGATEPVEQWILL